MCRYLPNFFAVLFIFLHSEETYKRIYIKNNKNLNEIKRMKFIKNKLL